MPRKVETKMKTKRRPRKDGSIYFREDVGLWYGKVITGRKEDGSPIHTYVKNKVQSVVADKVNALVRQSLDNGLSSDSFRENTNFNELLKGWYELNEAPEYSGPTDEKFRSMMKHHIFPVFVNSDIRDVNYFRLKKFFVDMKTAKQVAPKIGYCSETKPKFGYSDDFIGKMKNLLYRFFEHAVGRKDIPIKDNPVEQIKKEEKHRRRSKKRTRTSTIKVTVNGLQKKKIFALTPKLRSSLIEWVKANPLLEPILITEMYTGLRPQEIITLVWDDIDFETGWLKVDRAMKRTIEHDEEWNVISRGVDIGDPKTEAGHREIEMPDNVITALQEWQHYCEKNNIQSHFVFPNTKTGAMRTYSSLRSMFRRFMLKHDLEDVTLYTLRHTCATILLERGVNPKYAKTVMGHEKVETLLNIYSHDNANKAAYGKAMKDAMNAEHDALTNKKSAEPCTV